MKQNFIRSLYMLMFIAFHQVAFAQKQTVSNWQIGFGAGYTNYSGDLSNYRIRGIKDVRQLYRFVDYNKNYIDKPSLTVILQKNITPTLGFMIQANSLNFAMSDRYRNKNGSNDTNSLHYSRSLNFRTSLQDAGIAFTFRTNNGKALPANAFFYPSFFIGGGISRFKVTGDLYNESNQPYNYRLPGNINDGVFETNLRDQRTETTDRYRNVAPYLDLGLGLNFRLSEFIGLAVQSDIKYSASDYLDDVSSKYKTSYATPQEQYVAKPGYNVVNTNLQRGDDNGTNDFYINNRVVLSIGLGRGKTKTPKVFVAPPVYALSMPYNLQNQKIDSLQKQKRDAVVRDSLAVLKKDSLSLLKLRYDSLTRMVDTAVYLNRRGTAVQNDSLQQELGAIRSELKEIRLLLRDQQTGPRYRQLQYQADSLKLLQNKMSSQRTPGREDNLRLRIYQLQQDSIRHELEKLQGNAPVSPVEYSPAAAQQPGMMITKKDNIVQDVTLAETVDEESSIATDTVAVAEIKSYNDQIKQLKKDKRYKNDPAFRSNVDSLNRKLAGYDQQLKTSARQPAPVQQVKRDTVINVADQRKIDSLQRRMKELEKKASTQPVADTSGYNKIRQEAAQRAANTRAVDSEAVNKNIGRLENDLRMRSDSVANLKQQLQRSSDSAAYFGNLASSATVSNSAKAPKKKWYKNLFKSKKKMDKAASVQTAEKDRYAEQQRQYQQQADRSNQSISDLEARNKTLSDQYNDLVSKRSNWRQDDVVIQTPSSPAVIYPTDTYQGNNYNNNDRAELQSLRDEIERLRNHVDNVNARNNAYVPVTSLPPVQAAVVLPAVTAPEVVHDTAAVMQLRSELDQMRAQLDSIKNRKPSPVVKEVPADPKFDVQSFPVTSVYFNSGSAVLASDQIRKLAPFGQIAAKNPQATVSLKGFTDPTGNPAVNQAIAVKRSAYVKALLANRFGIPESRVSAGEPAEEAPGKSKKPNPLQRRVDVSFN